MYSSLDIDIDEGVDLLSRRRRIATENGAVYNVKGRRAACLAIQTKITKHIIINKIDSVAKSYDNLHVVERDLQELVFLHNELDKAYIDWKSEVHNEQEQSQILKLYEEQCQRVIDFQQKMRQWVTEAKHNLEEQLDKQDFKPSSMS